jgi:hypothetical protein
MSLSSASASDESGESLAAGLLDVEGADLASLLFFDSRGDDFGDLIAFVSSTPPSPNGVDEVQPIQPSPWRRWAKVENIERQEIKQMNM